MENTKFFLIMIAVLVVVGMIVNIVVKVLVLDRYRKHGVALVPGGAKRLEILSNSQWKNTQVFFDGAPVGTIPDRRA